MVEATMTNQSADPHLFGISKVDDDATLRQMLGGWFPGIDQAQKSQSLAGVQANGDAFIVHPGPLALPELAYPVRVLVAVTLPASMVKPASEARPYSR